MEPLSRLGMPDLAEVPRHAGLVERGSLESALFVRLWGRLALGTVAQAAVAFPWAFASKVTPFTSLRLTGSEPAP